jgi:hypothetical protein
MRKVNQASSNIGRIESALNMPAFLTLDAFCMEKEKKIVE